MTTVISLAIRVRLWKEAHGQALIEYAMIAGLVAVAAGATLQGLATSMSAIFAEIAPGMSRAANQGS